MDYKIILSNQNKHPHVHEQTGVVLLWAKYNVRHCFGLFTVAIFYIFWDGQWLFVFVSGIFTVADDAISSNKGTKRCPLLSSGQVFVLYEEVNTHRTAFVLKGFFRQQTIVKELDSTVHQNTHNATRLSQHLNHPTNHSSNSWKKKELPGKYQRDSGWWFITFALKYVHLFHWK